ncbi:SDR family NAD(P)-dependent oxidoreductase [Streptomyces sp. NPDC048370]|uniref:SDR family NAD(P)-dependent oxidoreductase n=1 Tax=Streptomyces sp. NPDC048370 TaxID=3365540 RepID=UPI00371DC2DE
MADARHDQPRWARPSARPRAPGGPRRVVTGAARGLGHGLAYALSRHGARVALVGLEGERLARLASDLPGAAGHWTVDVTDADELAATAEAVPPGAVVTPADLQMGPRSCTTAAIWSKPPSPSFWPLPGTRPPAGPSNSAADRAGR